MKITIELTEAEVKGIKSYLKEVDGLERVTKQDITYFIRSLADTMHVAHEAVSDHIQDAQRKINDRLNRNQ